jgi:3-oxoacyl-[acyl-carrier-protein] synthase-1
VSSGARGPVRGGAYPAVREVVPHAGRMVLLSEVVDDDPDQTACRVEVGEDAFLREPGGLVPAWVGVEYMAQCVAAHAGLRARARGEPVEIGFLLGSRRLDIYTSGFAPGQVLEVRARRQWGDRQLGSFACTLRDAVAGTLLVEGHLTVYLAPGAAAGAGGAPE